MEFQISVQETPQQSTATEGNKWEATMTATGSKKDIEDFVYHCAGWPPNQEVTVDAVPLTCETCPLKDDPTCENYLCD